LSLRPFQPSAPQQRSDIYQEMQQRLGKQTDSRIHSQSATAAKK
jgi:hypothetical protein